MEPESLVRVLERDGIRLVKGFTPELLRRGKSQSYIYRVKTEQWGFVVVKYNHDAARIAQELAQYERISGHLSDVLVRHFAWTTQYIIMEYVNHDAKNLHDLLLDPTRADDTAVRKVVDRVLDHMGRMWARRRVMIPAGQPSGYHSILRAQATSAFLGATGTKLRQRLRSKIDQPLQLQGNTLPFSMRSILRQMHRSLIQPIPAWYPLHGDLNAGNILVLPEAQFRLIDPHVDGREARGGDGRRGGGDYLRDIASLIHLPYAHSVTALNAEPIHIEDGKTRVQYEATTSPTCQRLIDTCVAHARECGRTFQDPGWEERLWMHVASMFLMEFATDLTRMQNVGLVPKFENLETYFLGEAIEAYRRAVAAARKVKK